jgi:uncharacterized protein YukE
MGYISADDQLTAKTAAELNGAAADLREHARRLRTLIPAYQSVLDPVRQLDTPDTWAGQYADSFGKTRSGWETGLYTGIRAVEAMISSLNSDAFELEDRARKAGGS